jgi:hypothetical protein
MTELQQVSREIESYQSQIALGELLDRLSSNKDFKTLILDDYLRENAIRLVHLKSHPGQQTAEKQAAIMRQMDGIGALEDFLRGIRQQHRIAVDSLASAQEYRAQLIHEAN